MGELIIAQDDIETVVVTEDILTLEIEENVTELVIEQETTELVVNTELVTLEISEVGIQGPEGPEGPASTVPGPQGPPGAPGSAPQAYTHNQITPSDTWVIVHNLTFRPNANVTDSGGTNVEGDLTHDSANQLTITFSASFAGTAYLS